MTAWSLHSSLTMSLSWCGLVGRDAAHLASSAEDELPAQLVEGVAALVLGAFEALFLPLGHHMLG